MRLNGEVKAMSGVVKLLGFLGNLDILDLSNRLDLK